MLQATLQVIGGALFIILLSTMVVLVGSVMADLMLSIEKWFDE